MGNHNGIHRTCCGSNLPRHLAHAGKAHLGKKIEVVLVDCDYLGAMHLHHGGELPKRFLEHGIEHRDRDAFFLQRSGRVKRAKGRVGLHLAHLLRVVRKMIRVSQ
jgi:hypothetical protein